MSNSSNSKPIKTIKIDTKTAEVSPVLQKALNAMSEHIRNPRTANTVIGNANGFLVVKDRP